MAPVIEGYWGKQTSTLDWCEENYVVNYYVAEFWNTLSNCVMIFAPLLMVLVGYKEKHEKRFIYSFLALTVVGIGSWLFHMTLKYSMQLMDEVPMIWGSSFLIYSSYMMDSKPNKENFMLSCVLVLYCVIVTLVYILINAPIFHQVSYGIMVFCIVILSTKTAFTMKCKRKMHLLGIGFYALGFFLWNVDNIYCSHLRSIREHPVGKVSGMLFECHAWWHVFAGLGTYTGLLFGVHTRLLFLKQNPKIKYILCFWPYVSADTKSK
ncbi:alkaline ceramidase 3-like [Physella acuta]|uniref:alkaline ceramidase 3-like n=1 Tax=Physella acuta TaxID=109671 RepID=UPI0027DBA749|nr:alkaline ceramidase 3-like [Physella acuta]